MKSEKKELIIFLSVAFGIPMLMIIPLAIIQSSGKDTSVFALTQMFYPASGFMLAKLICAKDRTLLPKRFFIGFLTLTFAMFLWCFTSFFKSSEEVVFGQTMLIMIGSLIIWILYLSEHKEKRIAYGLKSKNWKLSLKILCVFLLLYFSISFIPAIFTGEIKEIFETFPLSQRLNYLFILLPINFIISFTAFLGEEYGWRCYFQPLLQKKFGLIKGVFVFGVLWGLWHMPLNLFFYAPETAFYSMLLQQVACISLGVFFAYAYMKTENLWLPVLLHYFNNNLILVVVGNVSLSNQEYTFEMVVISALTNFVIFLPFLFSKVFKKKKDI